MRVALSYPKKGVNTKRYRDIHVLQNNQSGWLFSGVLKKDGVGQWEDVIKVI